MIDTWKRDCLQRIESSPISDFRRKQYREVLDDNNAYVFKFIRSQTRYRQVNYVRSSYKVDVESERYSYRLEDIQRRYSQLSEINFECTLSDYHSKNQRKLATRKLREKIMVKDNYTCQICGKYMPDEVGLQVDHIIPVAKGGKTVESNLRVLCSKCNGRKSDKL